MDSRKIKILFFGSLKGGGRERRMGQLIIGLKDYKDVDPYVLLYHRDIQYKEVEQAGATIEVLQSRGRLGTIVEIAKIIKRIKPDIVHCWAEMPRYLYALVLLKFIYKYKLIAGFIADGKQRPFFRKMMLSDNFAFAAADAVVGNARAGVVGRKAPRNKSYVIHNGFDFSRLNNNIDVIKKRLELVGKEAFIVTMVAQFEPRKDYALLMKIAEKCQESVPSVIFLLVGNGYQQELFEKLVEQKGLKNVSFLGRRSDVEEILLASDVSILLTSQGHTEGISNTIMESMAAGLPVIATNSGGTPEIINDGINGFLVPVGDVKRPCEILSQLVKDTQYGRGIGQAARRHIKENFQLSDMTKKYVELYEQTLKK